MSSPKKKKRTRYFNSHMKKLQAINEKYTAKFQSVGLGSFLHHTTIYGDHTGGAFLSYLEMQKPAWEYADAKAERNLTWYQSLVSGNAGQAIIGFVVAVVLVVLNFVTAGATTPLTVAYFVAGLVGAAAGYAAASAAEYFSQKAAGKSTLIESKQGTISAYKTKEQRDKESNTLTNLMIYGGYEIYANGGIFNQGSAGSETFSNSLTFDVSKGLRGDLKRDDLDEIIHSRTGGDLAGGFGFHNKILNAPFPLSRFSFGKDELNEQLINKYRSTLMLLADAFVELNNLEFNSNGKAQEVYNLKAEKYTRPTKKSIYQNDFLDKLKNYNKNLRADFDYADDRMFLEKKKKTQDIKGALGAIESLEEFYNDKDLSDEFKAEYYIDCIIMFLDLLEEFCDFKYFTYATYRWQPEITGGEHASGESARWISTDNLSKFSENSSPFNNGKENVNPAAFINNHEAKTLYARIERIVNFPNFADEDRIFYDFSDLGILQKYYYKTTNKTYNGNEIIAIYDELLKSLYQGMGIYGCLFFETRAYEKKGTNTYNYSPYIFLALSKDAFDVFNTALKLPTALQAYDFSKIERSRDNTDDNV